MKIPSQNSFVLDGGDDSFANRQKALFDQLSQAEKSCNINQDSLIPLDTSPIRPSRNLQIAARRNRNETRHLQGKESIFKRPEIPAPKTNYRSIPDYHRNPHKWIKYDLEDVKSKDMSDKCNTQTALSFLHELKQRKKNHENDKKNKHDKMDIDDIDCPSTSSRISFRKPSISSSKNDTIIVTNDKPVFRNSKIIFPEYVVGQKQPKKAKINKKKHIDINNTNKQLKLDHLLEMEEDD
ncbi:hypothetical protein HCN44_006545 [Aphidius gifuensis]|uniref:U5 small nuclear ribonucleoprotein TSSC4 n=1 Tax=Aphidius gifuensis TaxID=684658 RepID=A0A834Y0C4_APHGI|nr:uncharacterized protein LOC122850174 [Aphidius gifuensis]KAF7995438.1 hypothetical protein HCN44_006545 [Aphidius gifuensis]